MFSRLDLYWASLLSRPLDVNERFLAARTQRANGTGVAFGNSVGRSPVNLSQARGAAHLFSRKSSENRQAAGMKYAGRITIGNSTKRELFGWLEPLLPAILRQLEQGDRLIEVR